MKRTMGRLLGALLVMVLLLVIAPAALAAETVSISQLYYDTEGRQIASNSNNECLITSYEALNSRATVTGLENAEVGQTCSITVNADGLTTDGFPYILDGTQRFVLSKVYLIYGATQGTYEEITLPISNNNNINNSEIAEEAGEIWSTSFELPSMNYPDDDLFPEQYKVYMLMFHWQLDASTVVEMQNATFYFNCPDNATIFYGSEKSDGSYPIVATDFKDSLHQITDKTITIKKANNVEFSLNPKTDIDIVDMIGVKENAGTKTYYEFLGWKLQGDTSEKLYSMTDTVTMGETDMVFEAQWKQLSEDNLKKPFAPGEAPNVPLSAFDAKIEQTANGTSWSTNGANNPLELGADGTVSYRATLKMNNLIASALAQAEEIESQDFAHFDIAVSLDPNLKLVDKNDQVTFSFTCTFLKPSGKLIVDGQVTNNGIEMETAGTKYTFTVPVSLLTDEEGNVLPFKIPVDWKPGKYSKAELQETIVLEVLTGKAPDGYDQLIKTTGVITGTIDSQQSDQMVYYIDNSGALAFLSSFESWYNAFGQGRTLLDYVQACYYLRETAFSNITIPANTVYAKLGQVTIAPADITIYTGGESYDGVVDGDKIDAGNGFPEPGFLITLPEAINEDYFQGNSEAQDLSGRVRFVYDGNGDGKYNGEDDRIWELERYTGSDIGSSVTSPEDGIARYVYKIDKDKINGNPLRMKIYKDDSNAFITSDDFKTDLETLYETLYMTIYSGGLDASKIKAEIKINGSWVPFAVDVGTATLTVRGTTNQEQIIPVGNDTDSVTGNHDVFDEETGCTVTVVADDSTEYYVNESQVAVDPAHVSLLSDGVVSAEPLYDYLMEHKLTDSDSNYLYRYLDLVDQTNGRAWITASKPVDVYWKVPDGADRSSEFKIIHFEGLDREYEIEDLELVLGDNLHIYSTEDGSIDLVRLDDGDWYLKFATKTFSPFVLVWEDDNTWPPIIPEIPDVDIPNWLNLDDHYAYIIGYDDGMVKPQNNITRAEVATIFFRLLTDEAREYYWSTDSGFSDVKSGDWYNNAVSTMVNAGIITGYSDGTFKPNANITRAEFATIAARFLSNPYSLNDRFYDTEGHWAEVYINRAAEVGWIDGYPDGSFKPNQYITRAEAVTLVNAVLGRAPHEDHLLPDMIVWPDNPKSAWYYEAIQEATNSHDYDWAASHAYEIWTELLENRKWSKLEKEWSDAYSAPGGEVMD